eukprot:869177-Rhodomonas_salina.1
MHLLRGVGTDIAYAATPKRGLWALRHAHATYGNPELVLHSTPCTLHPTPYTPDPTPNTLHPTPYTLHPTPQTLDSRHASAMFGTVSGYALATRCLVPRQRMLLSAYTADTRDSRWPVLRWCMQIRAALEDDTYLRIAVSSAIRCYLPTRCPVVRNPFSKYHPPYCCTKSGTGIAYGATRALCDVRLLSAYKEKVEHDDDFQW